MQKSKTINLLRSFSAAEQEALVTYLHLPGTIENEHIHSLYQCILSFAPDFNDPQLTKPYLFRQLFADQPYEDIKIRYLLSSLNKTMEKFLVEQQLASKPLLHDTLLLEAYQKRGLGKEFIAQARKMEIQDEKSSLENGDTFQYRYEFASLQMEFLAQQQSRAIHASLESALQNLENFYLIQKLKLTCSLFNTTQILSSVEAPTPIEDILKSIEEQHFIQIPAIAIYYHILKTLTHPEQQHFYTTLCTLLEKHASKFYRDELREMYTYALNYCVRKVNSGEIKFLNEMFRLYQLLLDEQIILEENELSQWHYKNVVYVGLRCEAFDWTHHFIQQYKNKIRAEDRENAYCYNMAYWHFYHQDFEKAMKLLLKMDLTDVYYHLDSRSLLLKTYYELGEYLPLQSLVDSFRMYLHRSKRISPHQRTIYLNLIKYVKKLTKIKSGKRTNLQKVKQQLSESKNVADIKWLMASVEALA